MNPIFLFGLRDKKGWNGPITCLDGGMEGWSWDSWIEIPPHIELVRLPLTPSFFFSNKNALFCDVNPPSHIFTTIYHVDYTGRAARAINLHIRRCLSLW